MSPYIVSVVEKVEESKEPSAVPLIHAEELKNYKDIRLLLPESEWKHSPRTCVVCSMLKQLVKSYICTSHWSFCDLSSTKLVLGRWQQYYFFIFAIVDWLGVGLDKSSSTGNGEISAR